MNPEGKVTVAVKTLQERQFDFKHITEVYVTKRGSRYCFCYEYGYLLLEGDRVLLVKRNDDIQ